MMKQKSMKKQVPKKSYAWLWILIIFLAVATFIVIAAPTKRVTCYKMVSVVEQEPYEDTEYYYEEVPYSTTECDTENLGYNINWASSSYCSERNWYGSCVEYTKACALEIKNLDNKEQGYFTFTGYGKDRNGVILPDKDIALWIQPQSSRTGTWNYYYSPEEYVSCNYKNFSPGEKTVCEDVMRTKSVQKSRTVTRYRDKRVQKQEPYYKTVNWIFGGC